jgi:single stranded DNA-binding protein
MPALNRVQLIGRLGKDPEARVTPTGKQVVSFSLAVSNHWKSGGETKESTDWFNIEVWEKLGEVCQKYLHKGSLVFLEGRLKTDKYEDKGEIFHQSSSPVHANAGSKTRRRCRSCHRGSSSRIRSLRQHYLSDVEPDVHDLTVQDNVVLAFQSQFTF